MKNISLIVILIGILIIAIPSLMNVGNNTTLWVGLLVEIIGLVLYIVFDRKNNSTVK